MIHPPTAKQKGSWCTSRVFAVSCGRNLECDPICPTNLESAVKNMVHERHNQVLAAKLGCIPSNNVKFVWWFWTAVHTLQLVEVLVRSNSCNRLFCLTPNSQIFFKQEFLVSTVKIETEFVAKSYKFPEAPENCCFSSLSRGHTEIHVRNRKKLKDF